MGRKKNIFCFVHFDLDGVVSYLTTVWAHPTKDVMYKAIGGYNIREEVTNWLLNNNFEDYDKIFFLDLDVTKAADLIDNENVFIIDHHKTHADNKYAYKKAKCIVKEYSSACLLAYKVFKKLYNILFTEEQKKLIIYGNDYDSYTLNFIESSMLNAIFWNTQKSFESFIETYKSGYRDFTPQQLCIYKIYKNDLQTVTSKLNVFRGIYADTDGECRVVVATFANKFINEVADYIIDKYTPDVVLIINMNTKRVSFRRPRGGTMKLDIFASEIAEGGGHEYSAGGFLTDNFMDFTKQLKPI